MLSYADPLERRDEAGNVIKHGHVGHVYRCHNAVYLGRSAPRRPILARDGRCLN